MKELEKVFQVIDGYRDAIIGFQADLTSRVALGPENEGSGEHDKAGYLKKRLEELQPDILEEIRAPDERTQEGYRPNLVAKWEAGDRGSTVWVLGHMDVVPPGDLSLWDSDPYQVKVEDDKIIGIVTGCLAAILLVVIVIFVVVCKKWPPKDPKKGIDFYAGFIEAKSR